MIIIIEILRAEEDKNSNILKIIELAKSLSDDEVRDVTNVIIGVSLASNLNK